MNVRCECGKEYEVHEQMIGKSVRCQRCSKTFVIQQPDDRSQPANIAAATGRSPANQNAAAPASSPPSSQWSAAAGTSDPKVRAEREKQIISQYVQYKPKAGERLRGAALAKANRKSDRRDRLGGALKMIGLGLGLAVGAVFGYFKLAAANAAGGNAQGVHWIMSLLNSIGGQWTAAIGLGLVAVFCITYGVLFWLGIVGRSKDA